MVDALTQERLLKSLELEQQLSQTEQRAIEAEQRAARLLELLHSQGSELDEI